MKLPNLSGYAIRCWGYRGSIISHAILANPTSSCIHPSTHNREKPQKPSTSTFENHPLYKLWRYSRTPAPVLGGVEVISPTNCIKEIFDVGKTQVFQNCNDKIVTTTPRSSTPRDTATTPKCQEAPRIMFSSQNHRNDSKIPA